MNNDNTRIPAHGSNIDRQRRFDNFVVGSYNRFAAAAAMAVADKPGEYYNPLFIYGKPGLGKTHLMHAIGNEILKVKPDARVRYMTSEAFMNEIINAILDHTIKDFQETYRTMDCLLIDDIQFIEDKERTQEEFFHTFNALREAHRQIVIAGNRHPHSMTNVEEQLRSRFANGLVVDIQPPDLETRIAILRKKAETVDADIPDEVIETVAKYDDQNINVLEGAFNRIVAYAKLMNVPIDMELAKKVIDENI